MVFKTYIVVYISLSGSKVNRKRIYITIAVAIVVIAIIAILYSYFSSLNRSVYPGYEVPSPLERNIIYAYRDAITGIDPGIEDDTGIIVLHLVYETLLRYDPIRNEYQYVLAKEIDRVNENTWRIVLRDAQFHDGSPVTAYDVNFSIWRSKLMYEEKGLGLGYIWDCLDKIDVVDNKTLYINTRYPCDIRVSLAAAYSAFIYSRRVLELSEADDMLSEKLIEWFNAGNSLGSGPYRLEKYEPENMVILRKFENWWGWREINNPDAPDIVIIKIVEDPGSQERTLRTGHIDIASSVPRESLNSLEKDGYKIHVVDTFHNFIMMFNTKRWPTNITEFRKAIVYAIPWDRIVEQALMGYGRKGSGLIPYGFPGYSKRWELNRDLEKARELLERVGLLDKKIDLEIVITQGYEEEEVFAKMLKEALSTLGINLLIKPLPWQQVKQQGEAVWSDPESAPHMIINDWWPTYMVPYDYFSLLECLEPEEGVYNYWNWAGYCNKEFDELLYEAYYTSLQDIDKSLSLYEKVLEIVFEDMPAVNLWDMQHIYVYDPRHVVIRYEAINPLYTYTIFFQYVEVKI